jgi:hypothetical protein
MIWEIKIAKIGTVSYDLKAKTYARAWREARSRFGKDALNLSRPARKYKHCDVCDCAPCACARSVDANVPAPDCAGVAMMPVEDLEGDDEA